MNYKDIVESILQWMFLIVAVLMIFFILLQEGKGGGLAALGGTKAAGVEGVTNPIRRFTGYLAGIFFLIAIVLGVMNRPETSHFKGEQGKDKASAETSTTGGALKPADGTKTPEPAKAPAATEAKAGDGAKPAETPKPGELKPAEKTPESVKAESQKTEPAKAEPAKTEPAKTDAAVPTDTKTPAPAADAKAPEKTDKAETKTDDKK